jgi:glutamate dehydrogenase
VSFKERERLFGLPRSSWADYDCKLISSGGGVYSRNAKSVTLTPEIKRVLGVDIDSLTPTDLIRAILKAPVDLV